MARQKLPPAATVEELRKVPTEDLILRRNQWALQQEKPHVGFWRGTFILAKALPFILASGWVGRKAEQELDSAFAGKKGIGAISNLVGLAITMAGTIAPLKIMGDKRGAILIHEATEQLAQYDAVLAERPLPDMATLPRLTRNDLMIYREGMAGKGTAGDHLQKLQSKPGHAATASI